MESATLREAHLSFSVGEVEYLDSALVRLLVKNAVAVGRRAAVLHGLPPVTGEAVELLLYHERRDAGAEGVLFERRVAAFVHVRELQQRVRRVRRVRTKARVWQRFWQWIWR